MGSDLGSLVWREEVKHQTGAVSGKVVGSKWLLS